MPQTEPGPPPPIDPSWVEAQEKAGMIPPPPDQQLPGILKPMAHAHAYQSKDAPRDPSTLTQAGRDIDNSLEEEDWIKVYDTFATTGAPHEITKITGLKINQVNHLLQRGVVRLGLPAIKEHAVDYAEVNLRLAKHGLESSNSLGATNKSQLPEVQQAVTDRVAKEAAAAQGMLNAAMSSTNLFSRYLEEVNNTVLSGNAEFALPAKITLEHLTKLAQAADKLASSLDRAVRLSRLTAGEPESNIAMEVSLLVNRLTTEELRIYVDTGHLPPRLRGRASAVFEDKYAAEPTGIEEGSATNSITSLLPLPQNPIPNRVIDAYATECDEEE